MFNPCSLVLCRKGIPAKPAQLLKGEPSFVFDVIFKFAQSFNGAATA
jgi:hypothetical protein